MKITINNRGFGLARFEDIYKSKCSIQISSLAMMDAIWLGVDVDFDGNVCTRMHLTRDMVKDLLPLLQHFVETGELPHDEPSSQTTPSA